MNQYIVVFIYELYNVISKLWYPQVRQTLVMEHATNICKLDSSAGEQIALIV